MAPVQKKQQTLASFFKKPPPTSSLPTPAQSLSDDHSDDDPVAPPGKRRKITPSHNEPDGDLLQATAPNGEGATHSTSLTAHGLHDATHSTVPFSTARTSKYIFSSSAAPKDQEVDDANGLERRKKEDLHRKFVRKLGRPDSMAEIKRRNHSLDQDAADLENGDMGGDDSAEEQPKSSSRTGAGLKKGGTKLTPMEKQVIEIKRAHMDTVLVVEVGYKFRFFGEDARVAAKELSIVCIPGKYRFDEHPSEAHLDRFASASIPVHRLHVHVKRLVAAGHKVGVVRQLETAALKAVGDNRNAPFTRKLTNLYTKGTYIDDMESIENDARSNPTTNSTSAGFLLCLTETNAKGAGNDEKVHVGLIAVQPATGDIVYDDFEDGFMRSEIETRFLHIAPCELVIVGELSKATERLVLHLSGSKTNVFGDKIRVERVDKHKTMAAEAHSRVADFYSAKLQCSQAETSDTASRVFDKIFGLPENVTICLSAMIKHLSEYGLEHVLKLTKYFQPFSVRSHMLLNGNTLTSLEIYQNQTDHSTKGSLCWMIDRTQTKFGGRLLRKWVGRPLLDRPAIEERLDAVEELLDPGKSLHVDHLKRAFSKLKSDLEKGLTRIYYGRCSRPELLNTLQSLQFLATEFAHATDVSATNFQSNLISAAIVNIPTILPLVVEYLDKINLHAAKADDKYAFFQDSAETEAISEHKFGIAGVEHDLDQFRAIAAEKLGRKKPVDYVTVAGIEYLIEVENSSPATKKVPASWAKISGTKKLSRFHPPEVVKLLRERDQHKESLAAKCDEAYKDLLADIGTKYQVFRDAVQSLATLDCLLSLANVASQPGYVRPTFAADSRIEVEGARHPMVEQILIDTYVPNNVSMASNTTRALLVTGPNMGGKSSYVRSVALIAIMAQIGSFVPAKSATLGILDAVFTRMGAFDNMMSGESTFMVELSETSDILKMATERSLVVLDELGRGTSTHDGVAIAASVLDYLVRERKCLTLFITHYQMLARLANGFPGGELKNVHMRFTETNDDNVTFLYEVGEGVAHRSYGLNVARLANIRDSVIEIARQKSSDFEQEMRTRQMAGLAATLMGQQCTNPDKLEAVAEGIEML